MALHILVSTARTMAGRGTRHKTFSHIRHFKICEASNGSHNKKHGILSYFYRNFKLRALAVSALNIPAPVFSSWNGQWSKMQRRVLFLWKLITAGICLSNTAKCLALLSYGLVCILCSVYCDRTFHNINDAVERLIRNSFRIIIYSLNNGCIFNYNKMWITKLNITIVFIVWILQYTIFYHFEYLKKT